MASEHQHSFTCPYCSKMGYTETTMQEHVSSLHAEASQEVVCPICASYPGGDPNHVTDDFQGHLNLEHRGGARDLISFLDEPGGGGGGVHRQGAVRRIAHARGGLTSHRTRRHNNPPVSSSSLSTHSPSAGREAVDPIAELLSQLSGVRRATGSSSSQLQQLQMELQLQRQQAQAQRQTLDRLTRRPAAAASASGPPVPAQAASEPSQLQAKARRSSSSFLLPQLEAEELDQQESANKNIFIQELLTKTINNLSIQKTQGENTEKNKIETQIECERDLES